MVKICNICVMNNKSDKFISFNENGQCNYCSKALREFNKVYFPNKEGEKKLDELINRIKKSGKGKKYDCIMGLSGGLDSSYLAYLGYRWGLRVLAVHIDDGYDTDISKKNISKLIEATGFDYEVITPNSEQFNDLVLSYMKAGVPDIAVPQDNVLFAFLYKKMRKHKIKYFLSGGNFALESILQKGNGYKASDVVNIKDIHSRFGTRPIDKLKFISSFQKGIDKVILGYESPRPLNYIDYNRERAFIELKDFCDFEYYGRKHLENIFTAFVQLYWLPKKFGVDKRTSHLSSMIVSNQMTRDEAIKELEEPLYDDKMMDMYINFIKNKLGISDKEFNEIMEAPIHQHYEYKIEDNSLLYKLTIRLKKFINN